MPTIYQNRIQYPTHNVLCDPAVHTEDYIIDMAKSLTDNRTAAQHRKELNDMNNDGTWTIELPTIELRCAWQNDRGPRMAQYPDLIWGIAHLPKDNYFHWIQQARCKRSESFQPIWQAFKDAGIKVGPKRRQEAEKAYFATYDALVEVAEGQKFLHRQLQA